jgi:hypothetical protein
MMNLHRMTGHDCVSRPAPVTGRKACICHDDCRAPGSAGIALDQVRATPFIGWLLAAMETC